MINQIYALIAGVVLLLAVAGVALYYRGEAFQARGERDLARAQAQACSESVEKMKSEGDAAKRRSKFALEQARQRNVKVAPQVARLEAAIKNPPANATCDAAWNLIEKDAAAGSQR